MPDGTTTVERGPVDQMIPAAAYTSFLCSTNQTTLTQVLTGAPIVGQPFDMRYHCIATIKDATRDYTYDGRYRLHFTACPQGGRTRC